MGKFRYFPDGLLPRETPLEPFRAERENSFVENVFCEVKYFSIAGGEYFRCKEDSLDRDSLLEASLLV